MKTPSKNVDFHDFGRFLKISHVAMAARHQKAHIRWHFARFTRWRVDSGGAVARKVRKHSKKLIFRFFRVLSIFFFCSEDLNTIQTDRNLTKSILADSISPGVFESHRMQRGHPPKKPPRLTIDIRKSPKTDILCDFRRPYAPNADREASENHPNA